MSSIFSHVQSKSPFAPNAFTRKRAFDFHAQDRHCAHARRLFMSQDGRQQSKVHWSMKGRCLAWFGRQALALPMAELGRTVDSDNSVATAMQAQIANPNRIRGHSKERAPPVHSCDGCQPWWATIWGFASLSAITIRWTTDDRPASK